MPVQHSPPAKNTRSQRHQVVLTPTERAPLDCTPSVHQLSENLEKGPQMEVAAPSRRGVEAALESTPEASEAANLAHSNQPLVSQVEPNFLKMMKQMNKFIGKLTQAVATRANSTAPAFKTSSMEAPNSFYGTQANKLGGFIQSSQLIFHNYSENFFSDRKKVH
ncbi:hypothetical protein O181_116859 [Austropuccinia psidii MF-1]|uniref:Uncharacterized protein n=1 Tax=Austropuccinia psidii MF-1 TaxID=1389203 RepID=A0A9Q3PWY6_9BASI|nr:hypothetical protein [Austropuccinia psidii MF-1]